MTIGEQFKAKRKQFDKLSVPKLAAIMDIPADRIYKWEKGHNPSDFEDMKKVDDFIKNGLANFPSDLLETKNNTQPTYSKELIELLQQTNRQLQKSNQELQKKLKEMEQKRKAPNINRSRKNISNSSKTKLKRAE